MGRLGDDGSVISAGAQQGGAKLIGIGGVDLVGRRYDGRPVK